MSDSIEDLFERYGPGYQKLLTITAMAASFTMVMSGTIVNVATPAVMGAFGIGLDRAQLVASAFNVALVTSQLLNTWVVNTFGQRGGFMVMSVIFVVGSVICALGADFDWIVVGRILQGVAAGVVQPLIMVTMFQVYPPERRGIAMAIYSMGIFMAVAMGPVFGGIAIELLEWRYIFWAPIPVIAVAAAMGWLFIPSTPSENKTPFDWLGYGLLLIAVYCILTGLTDGNRKGWTSSDIVMRFTIGAIATAALIMSQLRDGATLIDFSLFSYRQYAIVALIAFVFGVGNFGSGYGVPVFVQLIQGASPLDAALIMLPSSLLLVATLPFTGWLADNIKPHIGIMIGLMLFTVGTIPMGYADVNTPFIAIMFFYIVSRLGMSFTSPFIMNTALNSIPREKLNAGGGTINFCRQLGGSLGLAAWVAFVETRTSMHSDAFTATQSSANATTQEFLSTLKQLLTEAGLPDEMRSTTALHYLGEVIQAQASTRGFQDGFLILVVSFVAAMVPAYFLGRTRRR
ncbi:MAG: DHA2 family multidrug resistance protein [Gammaproteobacteria bacterium]|jgi:DHA2 family multidrug resistance protein